MVKALDDGDDRLGEKVATVPDSNGLNPLHLAAAVPGCWCAGTSWRSLGWTSTPPTSTRVRRPPLLFLPIIMNDLVALNLLGSRTALASYPREVVSTCFVRFDVLVCLSAGETPLTFAINSESVDMVRYLLDHGADTEKLNK
jgi:hypothetical protein